MCNTQYDLTYQDLNPSIYFAFKSKMLNDGHYHAHEDFTEITYILSGKGRYLIEDELYDVEAGDMIICNPGVHHQSLFTNKEEPTVEFFAGFSNFHFKDMPPNCICLKDDGYILKLTGDTRTEISNICYEMCAESETNQLGKYFMLKAHLLQILLLMMREILDAPKISQTGYMFENHNKTYAVKRILNYLNEHYAEKISLDQIAHNMYLSPVYVSKIFKEETGESPINYLIQIRLEKAKAILEQPGNGNIRDIAGAVGYEDVYHFSKMFKKYYGMAPQHYRKSYLQKNPLRPQ